MLLFLDNKINKHFKDSVSENNGSLKGSKTKSKRSNQIFKIVTGHIYWVLHNKNISRQFHKKFWNKKPRCHRYSTPDWQYYKRSLFKENIHNTMPSIPIWRFWLYSWYLFIVNHSWRTWDKPLQIKSQRINISNSDSVIL